MKGWSLAVEGAVPEVFWRQNWPLDTGGILPVIGRDQRCVALSEGWFGVFLAGLGTRNKVLIAGQN